MDTTRKMHRVWYSPVEDGDQWQSLNTSGSTTAIIGGLSQDEIYMIRVSSVSPLGQGPTSDPVMVTIQALDDCLQCKLEAEIGFYCNCSSKILEETCMDMCRFRCKNTQWFEPIVGCLDDCITGWYGQYCNMSCPGMCLECDKVTGKCVTCISQWAGSYCNKTCPEGLYGENCSMSCSTHCNRCLNDSYCNECKSGRYGESCQELCHPNCLTCIEEPQKCTSCILGKFLEIGSVCLDCPENCVSCSGRDKCIECKTGNYGPKCEFKCPPNCITCTSSDQCNKCVPLRHGNKCQCNSRCANVKKQCETGEVCQNGCPPLKMGIYCNHSCPQNCYKCDQLTGLCLTCVNGFYGTTCNQTCGHCKRNSKGGTQCKRHTGKCEECMSGWHGWRCNESCSTGCRTSHCDRFTGKCDSCMTGYYGPQCKEECNKNCYNVTMTGCEQQTGFCKLCANGFYGYSCSETCVNYCGIYPCDKETGICEKCPNGLYGEKCNKRCNPRCHDSNTTTDLCDRESGYCIQGCNPGWYNEFCQSSCSATCMDNLCKQDTGLCLLGCVHGFNGDTCSQNIHEEYLLSLDVRQIGAKRVLIQWDKLNLTDAELESVKRVVLNHKIQSSTTVDGIDVTDCKTRNYFLLQDVDVNNKHTFQLVVLFELRWKSPIISKPVEFVLEPRAPDQSILHLTTDVEIYGNKSLLFNSCATLLFQDWFCKK
ncbi:hypothetical protein CHS0354_003920 [Potamilus streckersoni]|uniref:Fibronectin type-III domain-containing protein n=1 Tax=Potamilus streckersoni TaxID=2493646 RepID=A0AAE0S3H8_9BIVA|nr:hypothetical protein CHS0354_003920 [Potamilus streckersoni]